MDYLISHLNSFTLGTGGITEENLQDSINRDFEYIPESETLIVCLPGWGGKLAKWKILKVNAIKSKTSFLAYEFPRGIFSDEMDMTKKLFEQVNLTVRKEISDLKNKYGFKKCILLCVSLASSYGSIIYRDNSNIDEVILVAPGENLAKDMWHGCRTQHFRKSYEKQSITESRLIELWSNLASQNNIPAANTKVSIFFGKNDEVIPYRFSRSLAETYKKHGLEVIEKTYSLGHYLLISLFLFFPGRFLKLENLIE
jgi:hypothetical protein